MDTITQATLGAALGEAGWRKALGPKAIAFGALCGLIPDFDAVAALWGDWASLEYHRSLTHSVLFAPVVSPALGWIGWRWAKRRGTPRQWTKLAFWGLFTHPLLDVFTSYGTQLLYPFSKQRFALDGVSIIDPIYTFPLLIALFVALLWRKRPEVGAWATRLTLGLTTLYLLFGWHLAGRAEAVGLSQAPSSLAPTFARATPTFGNMALWRVILRGREGNLVVGYTSHIAPTDIKWHPVERAEDPAVITALGHPHGQLFQWFSDGLLATRVTPEPGGTMVELVDVRYGGVLKPAEGIWLVEVHLDNQGEVLSTKMIRPEGRRMDIKAEFAAQWQMIWNGAADTASTP